MEEEIDDLGNASLRLAAGDPSLFSAEPGATLGALEEQTPERLIYRTANAEGPLAGLRYVLDSAPGGFGGSEAAGLTGTITGLRVFDGQPDSGTLLYSVAEFALPLASLFDGSLGAGPDAVDRALFDGATQITAAQPEIDTAALLNTRFNGETDIVAGADRDDTAVVAGLSEDFTASGALASFVLAGTDGAGRAFLARLDSIEFVRFDDVTLSAEALLGLIDNPPVVDMPLADQDATVGVAFAFTIPGDTFSDPDDDTLTFRAATPVWLVFDPATGAFSGTPGAEDVGVASVTLSASDGRFEVSDVFAITVEPPPVINLPPVLDMAVPDQTAVVGEAFSLTVPADTFSDPNDDALALSAAAPAWLVFDPATGVFTGTPGEGDTGVQTVTLAANDGEFTVTDQFEIDVMAAPAESIVVTTALDLVSEDEVLSLREAVALANVDAGTEAPLITFDPSLAGQVLRLTEGEIAITRSMVIDGTGLQPIVSGDADGDDVVTGANLTDINATRERDRELEVNDDGLTDNSRIFDINLAGDNSGEVTLRALTLTGGVAPQQFATAPGPGGEDDLLIVTAFGGAISAVGTLTIEDSLIAGNTASVLIGRNELNSTDERADGGGINVQGSLTVTNSTISDNVAEALNVAHGGGVFVADFDSDGGQMVLTGSSTITRNEVRADLADGGGVAVDPGTLEAPEGAISGNFAFDDGAPFPNDIRLVPPGAPASTLGETFTGGAGRDIVGTPGIDTVTYALGRADGVALAPSGAGVSVSLPGGTVEALTGVERVALADGLWLLGLDEGAETVYRLFSAAFGRRPDEEGLLFWEDARQGGMDSLALAGSFVASDEFADRFGGPEPADALYVAELYENVLGRPGEPSGAAFWEARLAAGDGRAEVLLAFAESAENRTGTAEDTDPGLWVLG